MENYDQNKPLLILNASAGSGKTYNLVRYYLKLVLRSENPVPVGKILAMTFTNKASSEMKSRIIDELFRIAYAEKLNDPKINASLNSFAFELKEASDKISRNARIVLKSILHQYEDFNVMTIDKFNLRLIRSFSRDLNLSENFEVILNEKEILEKAVDELLSSISDKNKNEVYFHAIEYAKNSLDEENDWQIRKEIIKSAGLLQKEAFRNEVEKLREASFSESVKLDWKKRFHELFLLFEETQKIIRESVLSKNNDEFAGKSTTLKGIKKLINSYSEKEFQKAHFELSDPSKENLLKSNVPEEFKTSVLTVDTELIKIQSEAEILHLLIRNFHIMGVLAELSRRLKTICEKEGVVLISDFNQLIGDLINEEEAPFIYERLGNKFSHFFLDEFQDTSRMQFLNMIPLLHHSLAENQFSLIVGDPKQSIYRFKNGLAEQFVELPKIYNPEKNPTIASKSNWFEKQGQLIPLEDNWRSNQEIVKFNNAFFEKIISVGAGIPESGRAFYSTIEQNPKGKTGGYVEVQLFDKETFTDENPHYKLLLKWVEECITAGFQKSDICVLGLKGTQCNSYATTLKNAGYEVVSADSLLIHADQYVQMTVDFLNWFANPKQEQRLKVFAERFFKTKFKSKAAELYLECFTTIEEKKHFSTNLFFQKSGLNSSITAISYPDIYSLIKSFFRSINLSETENAYLHQLLDLAHDFDKRNGPDLRAFLELYEQHGKKTNVDFVADSNAITVMTTHKSKGLEFPIVLIPNTNLTHSRNSSSTFLTEIEGNIVRSGYSKSSKLEKIKDISTFEDESRLIDGLNLTYVAYTRPINRLYISGFEDKGGLMKIIQPCFNEILTEEIEKESGATFARKIGEKSSKINTEENRNENTFRSQNLGEVLWFPEISLLSPVDKEESEPSEERRMGVLFHQLMENAKTILDTENQLKIWKTEGLITKETEIQLLKWIQSAYSNKDLQLLLQNGTELNERTLIVDELKRLRPDKLIVHQENCSVVDFKTGEVLEKHKKQILDYVSVLKQMHYFKIEGYLYYASTDELLRVY